MAFFDPEDVQKGLGDLGVELAFVLVKPVCRIAGGLPVWPVAVDSLLQRLTSRLVLSSLAVFK